MIMEQNERKNTKFQSSPVSPLSQLAGSAGLITPADPVFTSHHWDLHVQFSSTNKGLISVSSYHLNFACFFRILRTDLWNLSQSNGHDEWRRREAQELSDIVQQRLHYLQVWYTLCLIYRTWSDIS